MKEFSSKQIPSGPQVLRILCPGPENSEGVRDTEMPVLSVKCKWACPVPEKRELDLGSHRCTERFGTLWILESVPEE